MTVQVEEVVLDIRGQVCPSTLLSALKEINELRDRLRSGEVKIVVLTTNRSATGTIPTAAENMGYRSEVTEEGTHYRIEISQNP